MFNLEKMEEKLIGTRNIKIYSPSDIYGPINFAQEKDHDKIIDCLGFYELIEVPKTQNLRVIYTGKHSFSPAEKNQLALKQIKDYVNYYIAVSKDDDFKGKLQMGS